MKPMHFQIKPVLVYCILILALMTGCDITEPFMFGPLVDYETVRIYDYQFIQNVYFFIDHRYRDNYFPLVEGRHPYDPAGEIIDFVLYCSADSQETNSIYGYAAADMDLLYQNEIDESGEVIKGYWKRLDVLADYRLHSSLGTIRLNEPVEDGCALAAAYRDAADRTFGDVDFNAEADSVIRLKLVKQPFLTPEDTTWDLMFRNVYYLGRAPIEVSEQFSVNIFHHDHYTEGTETFVYDSVGQSYSYVMGLDVYSWFRQGTGYDGTNLNMNSLRLPVGELEFPAHCPFDNPENYYYNSLKEDSLIVSEMYHSTDQKAIFEDSKYYIEVRMRISTGRI